VELGENVQAAGQLTAEGASLFGTGHDARKLCAPGTGDRRQAGVSSPSMRTRGCRRNRRARLC
jgi:hypothetical protein